MSQHQELVDKQWEEFLKQEGIVKANLYHFNAGNCVGNVKSAKDLGSYVRFFFNWSARQTKRGWVRRNYTHYDVRKQSLRNVEHGKPAELGNNTKLVWAGALDLNENQLLAPTSRNGPKEPKRLRPAPLLDILG